MNYTTYWSILDSPSYTTKSNSVCLVIAIIFGLLWLVTKKYKIDKGDGDKIFLLWGTGIFAVIGLFGYFSLTFVYKDNSDVQTIKVLNSNAKVEGIVSVH